MQKKLLKSYVVVVSCLNTLEAHVPALLSIVWKQAGEERHLSSGPWFTWQQLGAVLLSLLLLEPWPEPAPRTLPCSASALPSSVPLPSAVSPSWHPRESSPGSTGPLCPFSAGCTRPIFSCVLARVGRPGVTLLQPQLPLHGGLRVARRRSLSVLSDAGLPSRVGTAWTVVSRAAVDQSSSQCGGLAQAQLWLCTWVTCSSGLGM